MSDKQKDPYSAGKCPVCGEYATGTWRHPGAPVKCDNGHLWFRNTNIIATHSGDKIDNYKEEVVAESHILFSRRKEISEEVKAYYKEHPEISTCTFGVVSVISILGYLKDKPIVYIHVSIEDWCECSSWKSEHKYLHNHDCINFCPFCAKEMVKSKSK